MQIVVEAAYLTQSFLHVSRQIVLRRPYRRLRLHYYKSTTSDNNSDNMAKRGHVKLCRLISNNNLILWWKMFQPLKEKDKKKLLGLGLPTCALRLQARLSR